WAVYRTKHMITVADELTSQRLPILLVIPKKAGYSFRQQKSLKEQVASGEEREAMFVGLGDLIIPGILAVSSFTFSSAAGRSFLGVLPNGIIAFGTVLGSLVGFMVLMRYVLKGNPQAGLPLLNGGALLGFIIASLLVYGTVHIGRPGTVKYAHPFGSAPMALCQGRSRRISASHGSPPVLAKTAS